MKVPELNIAGDKLCAKQEAKGEENAALRPRQLTLAIDDMHTPGTHIYLAVEVVGLALLYRRAGPE